MSIVEMSIHQALAEIKNYDSRITKEIREGEWCLAVKKSAKEYRGTPIDKVTSKLKGNLDSITQLISNRNNLKNAIIKSNNVTKVTIAGVEYTVAEAIEKKKLIETQNRLLLAMKSQYANATEEVEENNSGLELRLESYLASVLGGEKTARKTEDVENFTKIFMNNNQYTLLDPNDITTAISKMEEDSNAFATEVDYKLSESNAITKIQVEYKD